MKRKILIKVLSTNLSRAYLTTQQRFDTIVSDSNSSLGMLESSLPRRDLPITNWQEYPPSFNLNLPQTAVILTCSLATSPAAIKFILGEIAFLGITALLNFRPRSFSSV